MADPAFAKAQIVSAKDVTIDDVVKEGETMYKKFRTAMKKHGKRPAKELEELRKAEMIKLSKEHPEFLQAYPIVFRYMTRGLFSSKALRYYIIKIRGKHPKTVDEYIESSADYVALLHREVVPHWNQQTVAMARESAARELKEETEEFQRALEDKQALVEAKHKRFEEERVNELRKILDTLPADKIENIHKTIVNIPDLPRMGPAPEELTELYTPDETCTANVSDKLSAARLLG